MKQSNKTQEALKMAIEALDTLMMEKGSIYQQALNACKEALAEAEKQEPVLITRIAFPESNIQKPAQESVAWMQKDESHNYISNFAKKNNPLFVYKDYTIPLYTHPAPSWQSLSDDDVKAIEEVLGIDKIYIRAIERTLKEKNQ